MQGMLTQLSCTSFEFDVHLSTLLNWNSGLQQKSKGASLFSTVFSVGFQGHDHVLFWCVAMRCHEYVMSIQDNSSFPEEMVGAKGCN